jgi:hypothetical protein
VADGIDYSNWDVLAKMTKEVGISARPVFNLISSWFTILFTLLAFAQREARGDSLAVTSRGGRAYVKPIFGLISLLVGDSVFYRARLRNEGFELKDGVARPFSCWILPYFLVSSSSLPETDEGCNRSSSAISRCRTIGLASHAVRYGSWCPQTDPRSRSQVLRGSAPESETVFRRAIRP